MRCGSFHWTLQAFSSRALLLRRANAERPHFTHRFFFRSILKELNADKEKFELGKSLFYIFMLFLVQLLQSIFVGRYLFAAQLIFQYYKPKLSIRPPFFLQVRGIAQLCSREERHSDNDIPQDSRTER